MTQDEQIKALEERVALLERIVSLGLSAPLAGKTPAEFRSHVEKYDRINAELAQAHHP